MPRSVKFRDRLCGIDRETAAPPAGHAVGRRLRLDSELVALPSRNARVNRATCAATLSIPNPCSRLERRPRHVDVGNRRAMPVSNRPRPRARGPDRWVSNANTSRCDIQLVTVGVSDSTSSRRLRRERPVPAAPADTSACPLTIEIHFERLTSIGRVPQS